MNNKLKFFIKLLSKLNQTKIWIDASGGVRTREAYAMAA